MCRKLQHEGRISAILLPDGTSAPPMHQHADDTTIHMSTADDLTTVVQEAVRDQKVHRYFGSHVATAALYDSKLKASCELPKYLCTFWSCKFQKKMTASSKPFVLAFVIGPAMIFPF